MYNKDKVNRVTLRLTERQFLFVKQNADVLGVSPSEFLRMVVNSAMSITDLTNEKLKGVCGRANDETDIDNKL